MSKIIKLVAENVKKLEAVEIAPTGDLVVISGANGAGKSSVMDALWATLAGKPDLEQPVRAGNDLDANSMKELAEAAHEAGLQLWIERIAEDQFSSVVIEDGEVKHA